MAGAKSLVGYYAQQGQLDRIAYVVNLDGMGRGSTLEMWLGPEDFEAKLWAWLRTQPVPDRVMPIFKFPPPPGSDHAPFYEVGIPVVMFTFNDEEILHRSQDR